MSRFQRSENPPPSRLQRSPRVRLILALFVSITFNALFIASFVSVYRQKEAQNPNLFWTPFSSRLKYHVQRFTSGFGNEVSKYQGPASEQKDADWAALYVEAFTLPKSEAQYLANKTVPATDDPDSGYLTSFSVFHNLHCLDMIRKVTEHLYYPEHYNLTAERNQWTDGLEAIDKFEEHGTYADSHIGHCLDTLRQALSCKPDLSPVVWQWVPWDRKAKVWAQTVHSCANFDDMLDYAKQRAYTKAWVDDRELEAVGQCGYFDKDCGFQA